MSSNTPPPPSAPFNPDDDAPMDLPPPPPPVAGTTPPAAVAPIAAANTPAPTQAVANGDGKDKKYVGTCLCKKVKVTVTGLPNFSGFCHCTICAKHGGTDRGMFAGWAKDKVVVTDGKDNIGTYKTSERLTRNFCKTCGAGIINEAATFTGVSPALFSDGDKYRIPKELAPSSHIHYGSSCLLGTIKDGSQLPLFKDVPKLMGGSGDIIKE